eukprot:gene381-1014_t
MVEWNCGIVEWKDGMVEWNHGIEWQNGRMESWNGMVLSLSRARSQGSEPRVQLIDNDTKVKKKKDNSLPFIIPPCKKGTKDVKTAGTSTLSRLHKNCQNNKRQRKDDTTWHAILYRTDEDMYFCQAVFIDVDWLITVAHCLVGYDGKIMKPDVVRVRMKGSSQRLKVAKIEVHKSFKYSTFTRDIALLKTESSAAESASNFVPICLPSKAVVNAHALTQAWWEGDVFDGSSRGDFFQGRAKKMSLVNCKRKIAKKTISYSIENWNICTENPDYCKGDIWMRMSDASPMYTTKGTDDGDRSQEWAAKAAMWAQQRHVQEQYQQPAPTNTSSNNPPLPSDRHPSSPFPMVLPHHFNAAAPPLPPPPEDDTQSKTFVHEERRIQIEGDGDAREREDSQQAFEQEKHKLSLSDTFADSSVSQSVPNQSHWKPFGRTSGTINATAEKEMDEERGPDAGQSFSGDNCMEKDSEPQYQHHHHSNHHHSDQDHSNQHHSDHANQQYHKRPHYHHDQHHEDDNQYDHSHHNHNQHHHAYHQQPHTDHLQHHDSKQWQHWEQNEQSTNFRPPFIPHPQHHHKTHQHQTMHQPHHPQPHHQGMHMMAPNFFRPPMMHEPRVGLSIPEQVIASQIPEISESDAGKRKVLPQWLREGLSQMEKDKQRKDVKQKVSKDDETDMQSSRSPELNIQNATSRVERGRSKSHEKLLRRSGYSSDDEQSNALSDEEDDRDDDDLKKEEDDEEKSPKEKAKEEMMKIRQWMMETLLSVTSQEILSVVNDVCSDARKKAPVSAKLLHESGGLQALRSGLGMGYDSSSGGESDDEADEPAERSRWLDDGDEGDGQRMMDAGRSDRRDARRRSSSSQSSSDREKKSVTEDHSLSSRKEVKDKRNEAKKRGHSDATSFSSESELERPSLSERGRSSKRGNEKDRTKNESDLSDASDERNRSRGKRSRRGRSRERSVEECGRSKEKHRRERSGERTGDNKSRRKSREDKSGDYRKEDKSRKHDKVSKTKRRSRSRSDYSKDDYSSKRKKRSHDKDDYDSDYSDEKYKKRGEAKGKKDKKRNGNEDDERDKKHKRHGDEGDKRDKKQSKKHGSRYSTSSDDGGESVERYKHRNTATSRKGNGKKQRKHRSKSVSRSPKRRKR